MTGTVPAEPATSKSGLLGKLDLFQQRNRVTGFAIGVVKKFGDDRAGRLAALIAYYGFFSIFPALLALVTVLGFVLEGNATLRNDIAGRVDYPSFLRKRLHSILMLMLIVVLLVLSTGLSQLIAVCVLAPGVAAAALLFLATVALNVACSSSRSPAATGAATPTRPRRSAWTTRWSSTSSSSADHPVERAAS